MATIRFHFDFISPYAYLAWTQIHAIAERTGATVEPVPVLFAALLDAHGTKGPAEVPARRSYLVKDIARIAKRFGVTINAPYAHPFNPLRALRIATRAPEETGRIFEAIWVKGEDASKIEGPPDTPEVKDRLRKATEDALAKGIFGVPSMMVSDELFWGCDSLPHLEAYLRDGERIPAEWIDRWRNLPTAASRVGAR